MRFSVVVPAYNAERGLRRCLDSILVQDHADVEVVCVDDGSTDDTPVILGRLAKEDSRLCVVRQRNQGVSAARNAGLERATGDVVLFVDADDELIQGALACLSGVFASKGPDCVVFGLAIDPAELAPITLSHRLVPCDVTYEGFDPRLIFKEHTHPYAFRVAFLRSFLLGNGLRFDPNLSLGEDEAFLLSAYRLSARTVLLSKVLYRYRMEQDSASHRDNASLAELPAKLQKHLALVESVLGDWMARGLDGSCDAQIVVWALDLLLLDISRLEASEQRPYYARLVKALEGYFGKDPVPVRGAAKACYGSVVKGLGREGEQGKPFVSRRRLIAFYLSTRGIAAVAERALASLRGRGAY